MLSKKLLKSLPFNPPEEKAQDNTYVHATKHRINGETVLSLSLSAKRKMRYYWYQGQSGKTGFIHLKAQLFLMKDGYRMLLYEEDGSRWSEATLKSSDFPWDIQFVSKKEKDMVDLTLQKWGGLKSIDYAIYSFQNHILEQKRIKKYKKDIDYINSTMKLFGSIPKGYANFVKDKVLFDDNYLFFSRKTQKAFCTYCGSRFEIPKQAKHNYIGTCPCCKNLFKWKSEGVGRGNLEAIRWSLLIQKRGDNILFRYFRHHRSFCDWKKPKESTDEVLRFVKNGEGCKWFEAGDYKKLGYTKWMYPVQHGMGWQSPSEWFEPRSVFLYNSKNSISKMIAGTPFQYSSAELLVSKGPMEPYLLSRYFGWVYEKKPYIEKLLKCGYKTLVQQELYSESATILLNDGRTLKEVLGFSKNSMNLLNKETASLADVKLLRCFEQYLHRAPKEEEWRYLKSKCHNYYTAEAETAIHLASELGRPLKLFRYFESKKIHTLDYRDYLSWIKDLNVPLNDFTLYPKEFRQAHDQRLTEYRKKQDEIEREKQHEFNKELKKKQAELVRALKKRDSSLAKGVGGLLIRLPSELSELDKEGATLHHCVATYKQRVMNGATSIYLIRKVEEPDVPYFTLEWRDGKIIQCRGKNNCDPTPDVKALMNVFEKVQNRTNNKKLAAFA